MIDRRQFKAASIFPIFQALIEMELKEISEYISETSSELDAKQKKLEKRYDEANKEVEEDDESDIHSFFEDDINLYFKVFPIYTFNPLLLALYGQFETWLKKLCDLEHGKRFSKVKVSDLAGNNYIEKSRKYMELIAELDVPSSDSNWLRIVEIQKIRNCIAHNNSNIVKNRKEPINKQELYKVIVNDSRFKFDDNSGEFYIKDKDFLFEVIGLIKSYLFGLIEKLQMRKVVARNSILPYDNAVWGQEKTESLLKEVISALDQIDQNEVRTDEYKDADLKANLGGTLRSMALNLTKIYSFFSGGDWDLIDQKYVVEEREKGLEKVKKIYGIKT